MTVKANKVFIAKSIDGYIADKNGSIDWLNDIPNPDGIDMGYKDFMANIDAVVMGRKTFETVCGFNIEWPYSTPVFVLSQTLKSIPEALAGKVELMRGNPNEVVRELNKKSLYKLYIDGGSVIQEFLQEDLIDEITITTIPILLGGGSPLFAELHQRLKFKLRFTKQFLNDITQVCYTRIR